MVLTFFRPTTSSFSTFSEPASNFAGQTPSSGPYARFGPPTAPKQARGARKLLSGRHNRPSPAEDAGGPTPETLVHQRRRRRGDTVEALLRTGALRWHHEAAALSIASVVEALTSPLAARGVNWERGRVDSSGNGVLAMSERLTGIYVDRYRPWAAWMSSPASLFQWCRQCRRTHTVAGRIPVCGCGGRRLWRSKPHLPLVLSIVVHGGGLDATATAYRMRRPRALRLLQLGLDRYSDFA